MLVDRQYVISSKSYSACESVSFFHQFYFIVLAECSKLKEVLKSKQKFISPSKLYSSESQVEVLRSKV